ncbi:MAG: riboflavin synthase [Bacteroidaceae bacterium]|nr:riboflavin synthase [Bacteroidaceae bacterium]
MFSGIVEGTATVVAIEREQDNLHFTLRCPFTSELKIDQSIAHNGVCLTVVRIVDDTYTVTAMRETLDCSNLGLLQVGDEVNVERSMMMGGRLDGHIVQGHVDQTARCIRVEDQEGSHEFTFEYDVDPEMVSRGYFTVDKGSVTVNGVSLTVCRPTMALPPTGGAGRGAFAVCIIPYTFDNTNFHNIKEGTVVNIEFDILGKYIANYAQYLKDIKES